MSTLTLTAKSQCTLNKTLLAHIGAKPGDTLLVKKMPNGTLSLQAAPPSPFMETSLLTLQGCIATQTDFSDAQIRQAIAQGYTHSGYSGLDAA